MSSKQNSLFAPYCFLPSPALVLDDQGIVQFINAPATELFGYQPEEIIGRPAGLLVAESFLPHFNDLLAHFARTGTVPAPDKPFEAEGLRSNATAVPLQVCLGAVPGAGHPCMLAVLTDLSALKTVIKELELHRERNTLAQRFARVGMWDWTIGSGDLYWSERIAPMFGYEPGALETSYQNFLNSIHPDDRQQVIEAVTACVERGKKYEIEHRIIWPDSTIRWLNERGDVIRDATGRPLRMLGVVQDVTARRNLEEELIRAKEEAEKSARVKSTFLANMSHEIRTPMNAILGLTEIVLESELTAEQQEHLTTVRSSAKALLSLLNDILDISKLESGRLSLEQVSFHLPRTIREVLQTLDVTAREKGLQLNLNLHPKLFHCLLGDSTRLRQILLNLVGNAIKFTEKGSVTVSVEPLPDDYYHFSIVDTGIGIAEEQMSKIFQPFTQADQSTARRYGGTGLGTTISKQLVELMDGKIWATSTIGLGSIFHFTIRMKKPPCAPHCREDCQAHAATGDIIPPKSKRKFRIMLVEDIESNIILAQIRLAQQGHEITVARNGLEALEAFSQGRFDLILMDVQMPEMDGLEATRRIRAQEKEHTPIIAMTASVMQEDIALCQEAGMDASAGKPIDFSQLFATMEQIVPAHLGVPITEIKVDLGSTDSGGAMPRPVGVDVDKGLRTWGNPAVYTQALRDFAATYEDAPKNLRELINARKLTEAHQLLHALKGVAGNLAISEVYSTAQQLGPALKQGQVTEVLALLPSFSQALTLATTSIKQLIQPEEKAPAGAAEKWKPETHQLLEHILVRLEEDNPDAVDPLLEQLGQYLSPSTLAPLRRLVDNFDFAGAKKAVSDLLSLSLQKGAVTD